MIFKQKKKKTNCMVPKKSVLESVLDPLLPQEYPIYCNLLRYAVHRLKIILVIQLLDAKTRNVLIVRFLYKLVHNSKARSVVHQFKYSTSYTI